MVKAHQHSSGAAGEEDQAISKSAAGNSTKIHMAADAHGLPIQFDITGGQVHDCKVAPEFIAQLPPADFTQIFSSGKSVSSCNCLSCI